MSEDSPSESSSNTSPPGKEGSGSSSESNSCSASNSSPEWCPILGLIAAPEWCLGVSQVAAFSHHLNFSGKFQLKILTSAYTFRKK